MPIMYTPAHVAIMGTVKSPAPYAYLWLIALPYRPRRTNRQRYSKIMLRQIPIYMNWIQLLSGENINETKFI